MALQHGEECCGKSIQSAHSTKKSNQVPCRPRAPSKLQNSFCSALNPYINVTLRLRSHSSVTSNQTKHKDIHNYTRNSTNFTLPPHLLSLFSKEPSYIGENCSTCFLRTGKSGNPQQFKKRLIGWLLERPIYVLDEYMQRRLVCKYLVLIM